MAFIQRLILLLLVLAALSVPAAQLTILQTSDIHGFIDKGDEAAGRGGWLRLVTSLRRERQEAGAQNSLLIDCGDTIAGSFTAAHSRGRIAIEMLRSADYDVWVPGNHELDYGVRRLRQFCADLSERVLCGNLLLHPGADSEYAPRAWKILERAGCRIAVIGVNSSFLDNWLWGADRRDFRVEAAMDLLRRIMPDIHAQHPDVILLAAHQGWSAPGWQTRGVNEVAAIAGRFPEIDLILGGHTHREIPGMRLSTGNWYAQAGAHANGYVKIELTVDTERHAVTDIRSRFVPVDDVPPDPGCLQAVDEYQTAAAAAERQIIGRVKSTISAHGRAGIDSASAELICRAIAAHASADVVIQGKHSQYDLRPGPVRERDIFRLVPYENGLGVALLTAEELRRILAEQRRQQDSYVYCGLWGAHVKWPKGGGVSRLVPVADGRQGKDGRRRYRTAFNSYTLAGGGGRFPELRRITRRPSAQLTECKIGSREALRRYIRRHSPIAVDAVEWIRR